jgi:hypothetical protein
VALAPALAARVGLTGSGDLPLSSPTPQRGLSGLRNEHGLIALVQQVSAAVRAVRRAGRLPLLVGGDCPVLLGALAASIAGRVVCSCCPAMSAKPGRALSGNSHNRLIVRTRTVHTASHSAALVPSHRLG